MLCKKNYCTVSSHTSYLDMFYQNIIDARVFAINDAIPYRYFSMPQDKHNMYLVGHRNLILPENSHYSGILYGMHAGIKKNGELAVRRSLINTLLSDPSRDYWTEVKKIHRHKSLIQNRVDDKSGSVDIANAFVDQYSMLYSSVPSEPTCLSVLLMRINTSVRNICQNYDFCIQHSHVVNSTQISDVIKRLRFGKSDGVANLYSDNLKHGTGQFFHCISVVINCMLCHGYAPTSFLHGIPIPKNAKLNLSSTCNYRAIALSRMFSKILDTIIMSLQSEYLMTSELQFGVNEHSSTIMCSTLLVETVEYYVSNNSTVYVILIDASKAFDRLPFQFI